MAVKTITVTQEAYRRLKARKMAKESFSDVIVRLTQRRPLSNFIGVLRPETGDAMWRVIEEDRQRRRKLDEGR